MSTFFLSDSAAVPVGVARGLAGCSIFAIAVALVQMIPLAVLTSRIVLACVDAERRKL
jgi:hypothetical protein